MDTILFVRGRVENHHGETSAPSLAVVYLGAIARRCGWHVEALDSYLVNDVERAIAESVQRRRPRVIGHGPTRSPAAASSPRASPRAGAWTETHVGGTEYFSIAVKRYQVCRNWTA